MSTESGFEKNKPWQPTKKFYESDPRSSQIRQVCIPIIKVIYRLQLDPEIAENFDMRSDLYAQLEVLNGNLIDLGIEQHIHRGKSLEVFQANPVTAAEFLAGQLIPFTGRKIVSEKEAMPSIQEFTAEKVGQTRMIESRDLPQKMEDFRTTRAVVAFIKNAFDVEVE